MVAPLQLASGVALVAVAWAGVATAQPAAAAAPAAAVPEAAAPAAPAAAPAPAPAPAAAAQMEACLGCHGDTSLETSAENGDTVKLFVDKDEYVRSVHGDKLRCTDCHPDENQEDGSHPSRTFKTKRDLAIAYYEKCKRCHFSSYSKTLDSVHFAVMQKGNTQAALCVDCHGSHGISRPDEPRSKISKTCAACHDKVVQTYARSVHGKALLEGGNRDVPVCTDCHRAHDIADPRARDWRLSSPELCSTCHTNEKLMQRYGLSSTVMKTYLSDFHGLTTSLQKGGRDDGSMVGAVCTDCHGVHDIGKATGPAAAAIQENLVNVCRKCHEGATANFPKAWLSHYEPSLEKTPLVWAVRLFYAIMIPFTIGGLLIQLALHLWRVVVNR